ncbi:long-chain fatty acid--CoA ligase [Mycobacterium sp. 21AC1]|uniref:acyl-CoA synthetase n=1 Tax=[Mycobacterium] appelbergii TaxID=2939269 RepID=UPI002939129E|nr:long-chain fatty acid--CoA ligase [Mycobacterium sp. 21AC1]MDV3130313.1 long-chain fatty acid--CoA ligase [Mycobacterium sp. 21AC1]
MTGAPAVDVGSWVARRSLIGPDRPAITFEDHTLSYGEFADRIDRLASELVAGGAGSGHRVGYLGPNHPAFLITLFACARAGATFVPLNFRLTGPELAYIINDAGIHTLIADATLTPAVDSLRAGLGLSRFVALSTTSGWEEFDELLAARAPIAEPAHPDPGDVAVIMYTSGTTGLPKGAMLTHGNLFWNNVNALLTFDVTSADTTYVAAPMFHIGGLNVTTLLTLQKGGHVILVASFDAARTLTDITRYRVTTMFGVPAMFLFMSRLPEFATSDLSSVGYFVCGGAPVPEPLMRSYAEHGVVFAQGYGLTETAPLALATGVSDSARKIGAAGHKVLPLSDVRVVDTDNTPVMPGEPGEICVRGPQVMLGYWNNPVATNAVIDGEGWFHTGDIGHEDSDGYIHVVDRLKDMVVTGGENVYPAEVESVLYSHPAVAEVAVVGLPDITWGEAVTAVVATAPGAAVTLDELRQFAAGRLARYKLPLRLEVVDALPRNPAGKVLKLQLRERFTGSPS